MTSMQVFGILDSQSIAHGLFISGYFKAKGCDWPPFYEWQGEQIWELLIPRVKEA
jgi:hypothetical protein